MKPKQYDLMNYSDVNQKKRVTQSLRDPLNPVYNYQKPSGAMHRYGDIEGARPKVTMHDVQEMLNKRIEPTWLTNQKYSMLRPEP